MTEWVKYEFSIYSRIGPLIPIIEGIHMNTQPDENNAAVESSSCCSLTLFSFISELCIVLHCTSDQCMAICILYG